MSHEPLYQTEIQKAVSGTDPELLNSLLLIRYLSAVPDAAQRWGGALSAQDCGTLWRTIAEGACRPDGRMLSVIKYALDRIKPELPFAPDLSGCLNSPDSAEDATLKVLVQQLDRLPARSGILTSIFEDGQRSVCVPASCSGDFYTPVQIVRWMAELLDIKRGGSLYDPCCGSGAMLYGAALSLPGKKLQLYGQALDPKSFFICRMNLLLRGFSANLGNRPANTLSEDLHADRTFDFILTNPPFNLSGWREGSAAHRDPPWPYGYPPRNNANFAWLQHNLRHLSPAGRAVILLPNGTLTTRNPAEREIRKRILLDGWVEAILALPSGLFHGTRVPCCAWVINRNTHRDTVLLVDARQADFSAPEGRRKTAALLHRYRKEGRLKDSEWYATPPIAEITRQESILSPNLYTRPKKLLQPSLRQLSDAFNASADALCARISSSSLCKSIQQWKTAALPTDWEESCLTTLYTITGGVAAKKDAFGHGMPMADVKTVIHHMFLPEVLPARVQLPEDTARQYLLRAGDILMNRTSETVEELACCCVVPEDRAAVYGAYLKRLRPNTSFQIDPWYAAAYFRSRVYRQEVQRVSPVYTTRASMNLQQLSQLRLYAPSADWQQALGKILYDVVRFGQTHNSKELDAAIGQFTEAFIERFITYPISAFQKERDRK